MAARAVLRCDDCSHTFEGMAEEDFDALRARAARESLWVRSAGRDLCDTCYEFDNQTPEVP